MDLVHNRHHGILGLHLLIRYILHELEGNRPRKATQIQIYEGSFYELGHLNRPS